MAPPLAYSDSTFEQQATNLVDDCCASHHPALSYPMQGLQIELVVALDRYEAHLRPPDCLRNRFGINVVALVVFYVRLYILRRHQPYLMTLLSQSPPEKVRPSAGFHANQFDLQVRSEEQQLFARKLLAYYNLAARVKPNQMKVSTDIRNVPILTTLEV